MIILLVIFNVRALANTTITRGLLMRVRSAWKADPVIWFTASFFGHWKKLDLTYSWQSGATIIGFVTKVPTSANRQQLLFNIS
jgi:hypothetical protein